MRLLTWNINSVRFRLRLLLRVMNDLRPDVICLQETKAENGVFPLKAVHKAGYMHTLLHGMKSYNGVAILSRLPLQAVETPMWCGKQDCRHVAARLPGGIELHNFYVPAGGDVPDPESNPKFAHKLAFVDEVTNWFGARKNRQQIVLGDLNVAPLPEDVWSHQKMLRVISHTPVEVEKLNAWQGAGGFVDALRTLTPPPEKLFSWWSYRAPDWARANRGRRLDHIWLSPDLGPQLQDGGIARNIRGWSKPSDHVPVWVDLAR